MVPLNYNNPSRILDWGNPGQLGRVVHRGHTNLKQTLNGDIFVM